VFSYERSVGVRMCLLARLSLHGMGAAIFADGNTWDDLCFWWCVILSRARRIGICVVLVLDQIWVPDTCVALRPCQKDEFGIGCCVASVLAGDEVGGRVVDFAICHCSHKI
jgi:hypothetical protein